MAKIKLVGEVAVVESAAKLEDIILLEKYEPKALYLYETDEETGKKKPVFRVTAKADVGSINNMGASFAASSPDERGVACITMCLPRDVEDPREYVMDAIGQGIVKLEKIEAKIPEALAKVEADKAEVESHIEFA